jgi:hypothetical protein
MAVAVVAYGQPARKRYRMVTRRDMVPKFTLICGSGRPYSVLRLLTGFIIAALKD